MYREKMISHHNKRSFVGVYIRRIDGQA